MRKYLTATLSAVLLLPAVLAPMTTAGGDYYVTAPNGDAYRIETGAIAIPHGLDVTECAEEGDNGCVWIGSEDGNGVGLSYYASPEGDVHYVTADRARELRGFHP
jgi:hypothetical protein